MTVASTLQIQLGLSLDRFIAMQTDQLQQITGGKLQKIQEWVALRQDLLFRLKQNFTAVKNAEIEEAFKKDLLAKLESVIDLENMLSLAARNKSCEVEGRLNKLRKGKRALVGYGPGGRNKAPKFLSSKG